MTFISPTFLIFFGVLCFLHFFMEGKGRRWLLLVASFIFIGSFNVVSLFAVIFFSTFNFVTGLWLAKRQSEFLFLGALFINCLAIILTNYFLSIHGNFLFSFGSVEFQVGGLLLVIGLSFYSLQHIAYLVDVKMKRILPETDYIDFLLISCYFPKFISGPITLYQHMKGQLAGLSSSAPLRWQGFNRMLLGFLKKMVIADRLAPSVASVFDYNDALPGITIFMAALFFTIQLYFDFSGYCDIAIGASKLLGIELPENFNLPLRSSSITVFWRRWHQTLIHFLTTYVFYPVSFRFRQLKKNAAAIAIVVTFFISALWHGIGLTFLAWGCCHTIYLLMELYLRRAKGTTQKKESKLKKTGLAMYVLALVAFSNLFFRANSTANAQHLVSNVFRPRHFFPESWTVEFVAPLAVGGHQMEQFNWCVTLVFTGLFLLFERKILNLAHSKRFRVLATFIALLLIFTFGVFNNGQRFIYMQF